MSGSAGRLSSPWLLFLALGAPVIWSAYMMASYLVVAMACGQEPGVPGPQPMVWFLGMGAAAAAAILFAWARSRGVGRESHLGPDEVGPLPDARVRFMTAGGAALSALFLFGVLLLALHVLVLPPCVGR